MERYKETDQRIIIGSIAGLFERKHLVNVFDESQLVAILDDGSLHDGRQVVCQKSEYTIVGQSLPATTSIGSYTLIYETSDGEWICSDCATDHELVVDGHLYQEGRHDCDHCGTTIYGSYEEQSEEQSEEELNAQFFGRSMKTPRTGGAQ
jgi:hypothetical protein